MRLYSLTPPEYIALWNALSQYVEQAHEKSFRPGQPHVDPHTTDPHLEHCERIRDQMDKMVSQLSVAQKPSEPPGLFGMFSAETQRR